jgi:hypothetical protein
MVNFITNDWIVERRSREFYRNELDLARNLVDVFNTGELKSDLNQLVVQAMESLKPRKDFDKALDKAIGEEKLLTLWEKYARSRSGVDQALVRAGAGGLEATYCSDLIRLMGAIIEEGKKLKLPWAAVEFDVKEARRAPAPLPKDKRGRPLGLGLTAGAETNEQRKGMVWGQKGEEFKDTQGLAGRDWKKREGKWVDENAGKQVDQGRVRDDTSADQKAKKLTGYLDHMVYASFRGMAGKEAKVSMASKTEANKVLQSVVGKMERVFGYPADVMGADISGTTADSTYIIERFAPMTGKDLEPLMYLLPFATIVASGHHHLLEVAGTLTLYGVIDYTVGVYETILPLPGWQLIEKSRYPKHVQLVKSHIAAATRNANRMLVYWPDRGSELAGAIELSGDDWKNVAQLAPAGGASLWDLFLRISPSPTLADIRDLLRNRGCPLATWMEVQKQIDASLPKKVIPFPVKPALKKVS